MEYNFKTLMEGLSESELLFYIDNKTQFQEEAVIAAIDELDKRGEIDSKLKGIKKDSLEKLEKERKKSGDTQPGLILKIPKDSPKTITIAIKLIYLAMGIGILEFFILGITTDILVDNTYEKVYFSMIALSLNYFAIVYIIRRNKWFRIYFIIIVLLELIILPLIWVMIFPKANLSGLLSLTILGLQFYALYLLYKNDSTRWYREKHRKK